ncbi:hypothetical protein AVJ23_02745 [Pseudoponticoccus marisrubri]|uniref:HEAT repeat domain-containing protein n=1 Tax=Pseudoponticoccus marisrubri TaxID=1685382 RepID=A0A0W7WQ23_9RHOB|nr:hypothetical protein AVJ23_02745 [Pseudoponticoccus marisrubri]
MPSAPDDLLAIPAEQMPDTMRGLIRNKALTPLMARIHRDLRSEDPALRQQGSLALRHMGFPE